jgi:hypothetical protein
MPAERVGFFHGIWLDDADTRVESNVDRRAEQSVLAVPKMDFFCSAGLVGVSYPIAGSSVDCC